MAVTRQADDTLPRIPQLQRVAEVPVLHDRGSSCLFVLPRASAVVPIELVPGLEMGHKGGRFRFGANGEQGAGSGERKQRRYPAAR